MKKVRSASERQGRTGSFYSRGTSSAFQILSLGVCFLFAAAAFAQRPEIPLRRFDVTGAAGPINRGRWASGINTAGVIAGYYYDALDVAHGFVRDAAGAITTFDAVGRHGREPGTFAIGINTGGKCGHYVDAGNASHGLCAQPQRASSRRFNVTGAGAGANQGNLCRRHQHGRKNRGLFRRWNERESRIWCGPGRRYHSVQCYGSGHGPPIRERLPPASPRVARLRDIRLTEAM